MEVGHSRLLKYLIPDDITKMSEHYKVKFEYTAPPGLEAEVPGSQKIREPDSSVEDNNAGKDEETGIVIKEEETLTPILKVTRSEASYAKGPTTDWRLHKITVTEDVSKPSNGFLYQLENPMYSEIISIVPEQQMFRELVEGSLDTAIDQEKEDHRPKSKIPTFKMREKEIVERVKKDQESEEKKEQEISSTKRRRSIPRLKKRRFSANSKHDDKDESIKTEEKSLDTSSQNNNEGINTCNDTKIPKPRQKYERKDENVNDKNLKQDKTVNKVLSNTSTESKDATLELVEDFDSLLADIADEDPKSLEIVDEILDNVAKVEDSEKVETKFEEIIHAYDENEIKPTAIEEVRSRIPLIKQKSLHDIKLTKKFDRRFSLKDTPNDGNVNKNNIKFDSNAQSNRKVNFRKDAKKVTKEQTTEGLVKSKDSSKHTENDFNIKKKPNNKENAKEIDKFSQSSTGTVKTESRKEIVEEKYVTEKIKVAPLDVFKMQTSICLQSGENIKDIDNVNKTNNIDEKLTEVNECENNIPNSSMLVRNIQKSPIPSPRNINNKDLEERKRIPTEDNKNIKHFIKTQKQSNIPLSRKHNVATKAAIFNKEKGDTDRSTHTSIKTDDKIIEKLENKASFEARAEATEVEKVPTETHAQDVILKHHQTIDKPETKEPLKSNTEEKDNMYKAVDSNVKTNTIDTRNDYASNSLFKDLPKGTEIKENTNDTITVTATVEKNDTLEFKKEVMEKEINNLEDVPVFKGKVSRIVNRIISREDTVDQPKTIIEEIPKRRSVSSKIAMFERQASYETQKILNKPKIVDEVLKSQNSRKTEAYKADNDRIEATHKENDKIDTNLLETNSQISTSETTKEHIDDKDKITFLEDDTVEYRAHVVEVLEDTFKDICEVIDTEEVLIEKKEVDNFAKENLQFESNNRLKYEVETKESTEHRFDNDEVFVKHKDMEQKPIKKDYEKINSKREVKEKEIKKINVEERIRRMQSKEEMLRSKSLADLEVGNVVKGKVHQMIVRIHSREELDLEERRDIINVKERPRKKSVSEKIALFERKVTPAPSKMADSTPNPITTILPPPVSEEEYMTKIEALRNASATYGKKDMTYMTLSNGVEMPVIALGTALLDPTLTPHIVSAAIDLGYRGFDTAYVYGNEKAVGEGIRAKIEDGTVTRQDLFITNKLWSTFHRPDLVEQACRNSLAAMGLEYFDLYLIHNPMSFKEGGDAVPKIANVLQYSDYDYMDAWYAMEDLVRKGLVRSIGVSNFNSNQIARVVEKAKIKPVVNQVECHPYLTQERLSQFCSDRNITLSCFGVLGSKGTPAAYRGSMLSAIDDPLIQVMAAGLGITTAQLLVKYQIELGHAVIVKCSSPAHMWDNLQALSVKISTTEVDALNALNKNKRTYDFKGMGDTHRNYPFKTQF